MLFRKPSRATRPAGITGIGLLALLVLPVAAACGGGGGDSDDAGGGNGNGNADRTRTSPSGDRPSGDVITDVPDTLAIGDTYSYEIQEDFIEQRFSLAVPPGSIVAVDASAASGNRGSTTLSFGPTTGQLRRLEILPGQSSEPFQYVTSGDGSGKWTVQVQGRSGNKLDFTVTAPPQTDGGVEGDAGSNATAAKSVGLGSALSGLLGDEDTEDWYAIPLKGGEVVAIDLDMLEETSQFGSISAGLQFNGQPLASATVSPGGEGGLTYIFAEDEVGTAQLRLYGYGSYNFAIDVGPQKDGGVDGDAGGEAASARAVETGVIEGILGGGDRHDFYRLTLPLAAVVTIEASLDAAGMIPAEINVSYNGQPILIGGANLAPGQTESYTFVLNNDEGDDLIVQLSDGGRYTLNVDAFTQTDGGNDDGDAPGTEDLAMEVQPEGSFTGYVNNGRSYDTRDWYRFTATTTGPLTITLEVDSEVGANVNMRIREAGKRQIGQVNTGRGGSASETVDVEAGMDYTLHVSTGQQAKYTVTFE